MYTIIGGDGREYGPVTADQVRSWISGGRANLETKVKEVGSDAWKTIAECPEITGGAAAGAGLSPSAPAPAYSAQAVVAGGNFDVISCYERSWKLLKANFWPLVGVSFVNTLIVAALGFGQHHFVPIAPPVFGALLYGGLYYYFLLRIRGQPTTFGDSFAGFTKAFLPLLIAGVLIAVFTLAGFLCLVLPGIYLAVAYVFTCILAVDKGMDFWGAMETSRRVITKHWWRVFGLLLLAIPFILLGVAACLVGIFVATPLITGAVAYAYEDLCNPRN